MVGARLLRTARMACARPDRIGSHPKSLLLGAKFRIQGYTLHLVSRVYLTGRLVPSGRYTSERLTRPYSGELPACAALSQRATIPRSPKSCILHPLAEEDAQLARQTDAKPRPALRASPQFGAGCA